jgi:hypothetical protein
VWTLAAYGLVVATVYAFLFVRRVSEKGLRKREPRRVPPVPPLTKSEWLALAKRDYFDQLAEIQSLHLSTEESEALQQHLRKKYLKQIDELMS